MTALLPGFADPVLGAQACFRAVLDAMSRPGQLRDAAVPEPPAPLHPATAAVLLTLVDAETPLWADPAAADALDWIAFHCGAPRAVPADAAFALLLQPAPLRGFAAGSDEAPEDGATLVLQVPALGRGRRLILSGPGLAAPAPLLVDGLPDDFVTEWAANHARFPLGVDLILCGGTQLAAMPRSVRVEAG